MTYLFVGSEELDFQQIFGQVLTSNDRRYFRPQYARASLQIPGGSDLYNIAIGHFPSSQNKFWMGARLYQPSTNSTSSWRSFIAFYTGTTKKIAIQMNNQRQIRFVSHMGSPGAENLTVLNTSLVGAMNTDNVIKFDLFVDFQAGRMVAYVNQIEVLSHTGMLRNGPSDSVDRFGLSAASVFEGNPSNWSEVVVATRDTRTLAVASLVPTHTRTNTWDNTSDHTAIDEYTLDESDIISTTEPEKDIVMSVSEVPGGNNLTVRAVKVSAYAARAESGPQGLALGIQQPSGNAQTVYGDHRWWRIRGRGPSYHGIREVEMMSTIGGQDICTGGTPIASGAWNSTTPATAAFDDNQESYWQAQGSAGRATYSWIGYQFASPVSISQVTMRAYGLWSESSTEISTSAYTDFHVEYSDNGTDWTTAWSEPVVKPWIAYEKRSFETPHLGDGTMQFSPTKTIDQGWTRVGHVFEVNPVTNQSWSKEEVGTMRVVLRSKASGV